VVIVFPAGAIVPLPGIFLLPGVGMKKCNCAECRRETFFCPFGATGGINRPAGSAPQPRLSRIFWCSYFGAVVFLPDGRITRFSAKRVEKVQEHK
jgi:hypothetical protein